MSEVKNDRVFALPLRLGSGTRNEAPIFDRHGELVGECVDDDCDERALAFVRSVNSHEALIGALKGMVGLCRLVRNRDDIPSEARQALTYNHRLIAAYEALSAAGVDGFQPSDFDAHKAV